MEKDKTGEKQNISDAANMSKNSGITHESILYEDIFFDALPLVYPAPTGNNEYDKSLIDKQFETYDEKYKKTGFCVVGRNKTLEMSTRTKIKYLSSRDSQIFLSVLNLVEEKDGRFTINESRLKWWFKEYGIPKTKKSENNVFVFSPMKNTRFFCSYVPINEFKRNIIRLYVCYKLWKAANNKNLEEVKKYSAMMGNAVGSLDEAYFLLSYEIEKNLRGIKMEFTAIPEYTLFNNTANTIYNLLYYQLACFVSKKDNIRAYLCTCSKCGVLFWANHGNAKYCGKYTGKKGCNKSAAYMKKVRNQDK